MSHQWFADNVALFCLGDLSPSERVRFEAHIEEGCSDCTVEIEKTRDLLAQLASLAPERPPRPGAQVDLLARLERADELASVAPPISTTLLIDPPELLGREDEIGVLGSCLASIARHQGRVVAIVAGAGVGKTRLLDDTESRAMGDGILVLRGGSWRDGAESTYGAFAEMFSQWVDSRSGGNRRRSFEALHEAAVAIGISDPETVACLGLLLGLPVSPRFESAIEGVFGDALERLIVRSIVRTFSSLLDRGPVLAIVDDAQWCNDSVMGLLVAILPLVETRGLGLVVATRDGLYDHVERLLATLREHYAVYQRRLELRPFDARVTRRFIARCLSSDEYPEALATAVYDRARGNPFYVKELLRSACESGAISKESGRIRFDGSLRASLVSDTVFDLVRSRQSRLSEGSRRVLELGAVLGQSFRLRVLRELLGDDAGLDEALADLEQRRFVEAARSRETGTVRRQALMQEQMFLFDHAVTREAVYGGIAPEERRRLHFLCAEAIRAAYADRLHDFHAALAYHYSAAERWDDAIRYLMAAGEQTARAAASAEALTFFREAHLVLTSKRGAPADDETLAKLEYNIGRALLNTGQLSESISHFNAALRLWEEYVPRNRLAVFAKALKDVVLLDFDLRRFKSDPSAMSSERDQMILDAYWSRSRAEHIVDIDRVVPDSLAIARFMFARPGTFSTKYASGTLASIAAFSSWVGLPKSMGRRAIENARVLGRDDSPDARFVRQVWAYVFHFHNGEWGAEHHIDDAGIRIGLRHGFLWNTDVYLNLRCDQAIKQGQFDEADRLIEHLHSLHKDWGYAFATSTEQWTTACKLIEIRQLDEARAVLSAYYDSRQEDTLHILALGAQAKVRLLEGDLDSARECIDRVAEIHRRLPFVPAYYTSFLRIPQLMLSVLQMEADLAQSGAVARGALREFRAVSRKARALGKRIARDRLEVQRFCARGALAGGGPRRAEKIWADAWTWGEQVGAAPELGRIAADIVVAIETGRFPHGATVAGAEVAGWRRRAREWLDRCGRSAELDHLLGAARQPGGIKRSR